MSLTCTLSLARKVESLSTKVLADHLVTLSAAFFGEWRFSRRMLLFVHLSSASLASCSTALTLYVFYPNNHFRLASFCEPNSLACQVLSTFHNIPGQSFAFYYARWNRTTYRHFNRVSLYQMSYCEPTMMCCPSCSISC